MATQAASEIRTHVFEKRSVMDTTIEKMMDFHEAPETMPKLSPPPIFVRIRKDTRTSLTEGEIDFTLWFGPIPIHWVARHEPGPTETSFADLMIEGPMGYWRHEHIFEQTDEGVALIDRITLGHKRGVAGILTRLAFDGIPLHILFFYRHLKTRMNVTKK